MLRVVRAYLAVWIGLVIDSLERLQSLIVESLIDDAVQLIKLATEDLDGLEHLQRSHESV